MPNLIAEGRIPLNVSQLMQRRLDVRNADKDVKISWMNNYFDTGDAIAYHPESGGRGRWDKLKIVLDSPHLRNMTLKKEKTNETLVLGEDLYKTLEGEEFRNGKLRKTGEWLSKEDVKVHPIWRLLSRDQSLLNDYADYIFTEFEDRAGTNAAMGVFLSPVGNNPHMRALLVKGLRYGAGVAGRDTLGYHGRLIGKALEEKF
jgi:hypothetical protein